MYWSYATLDRLYMPVTLFIFHFRTALNCFMACLIWAIMKLSSDVSLNKLDLFSTLEDRFPTLSSLVLALYARAFDVAELRFYIPYYMFEVPQSSRSFLYMTYAVVLSPHSLVIFFQGGSSCHRSSTQNHSLLCWVLIWSKALHSTVPRWLVTKETGCDNTGASLL